MNHQHSVSPPRRVVLAGGSGFLGQALADHLEARGWEVVILSRSANANATISCPGRRWVQWDGCSAGSWAVELEGASALINLTGLSVNCRYHAANRRRLLDSRLLPTHLLGEAVARCTRPPAVWLNSSTATIYRHTFGPAWSEDGEIGAHPDANDAFSIEIATAWEREFAAAPTPRTRKVTLRTAMVLGHGRNSVFPTLRRLVRLGLGGSMAGGRQFVSWIHERDFCRAVEWLIAREDISGVINLAAPAPVTNAAMMSILRELCGVPFGLPATRWMLAVGAFLLRTETELIVKSRRVVSGRLAEAGFAFQFPTLREAFQDLMMSRTTWPATSVRRMSRPPNRNVSCS